MNVESTRDTNVLITPPYKAKSTVSETFITPVCVERQGKCGVRHKGKKAKGEECKRRNAEQKTPDLGANIRRGQYKGRPHYVKETPTETSWPDLSERYNEI